MRLPPWLRRVQRICARTLRVLCDPVIPLLSHYRQSEALGSTSDVAGKISSTSFNGAQMQTAFPEGTRDPVPGLEHADRSGRSSAS